MGYVLKATGRHQAGLAVLSVAVFLLSTAPLELQRRIVNTVVEHGGFATVFWLAATYGGVALAEQSLKLALNIYRGWVAEASVRALRRDLVAAAASGGPAADAALQTGVEIAMILEEAEPIGGFVGISVSEPLLQCGILVSVIGYLAYLDLRLALLCVLFFLPQLVFVPLMQRAINRRARDRILAKRGISGDMVRTAGPDGNEWSWANEPIQQVFVLNMGIYKIKFTMNLLMNLMYHSAVALALCLGGWMALQGHIEVGTVVATVGGLGKLNDPWGDLVNWARELSVVAVKYRLYAEVLNGLRVHGADGA